MEQRSARVAHNHKAEGSNPSCATTLNWLREMQIMEIIVETLDTLGLALVGHNHKWTAHERKLYECSVSLLKKTSKAKEYGQQ